MRADLYTRPALALGFGTAQAAGCTPFMRVQARDYWRCQACEATFMDPAHWPTRAVAHAEYRLHRNDVRDPRYRSFLSRLAVPLLERLPPGSSGLDYGCGPGPALAAMLVEAGHHHWRCTFPGTNVALMHKPAA